MLDEEFYVFVYGTLKPGERAFGQFCAPFVMAMEAAIAPGRLYHLPEGYPAMTLEPGWVLGMRLTFHDPKVLQLMDEFEAYFPDRPQDSDYQRVRHSIYRADCLPLSEAWVYTMSPQQIIEFGGQWLPNGLWSERNY